MTTFQLDQCVNNRRLADECNSAGVAEVWRFPAKLASRPTTDPEVLARFMSTDHVLLTTDGRMPWEHTTHIPVSHPGIVVVRSNARHTLRIDDVRRILDNLKSQLTSWHELPLRNSIVELWPDAIAVYHVAAGNLHFDQRFALLGDDWQADLTRLLAANESRV